MKILRIVNFIKKGIIIKLYWNKKIKKIMMNIFYVIKLMKYQIISKI